MNKELLQQALKRAYQLGQTYWQQADSDSYSQHRKSDETHAIFRLLVSDTLDALRAAIAQPTTPESADPAAEIVQDENGYLTTQWAVAYIPNAGDKLYTHPAIAQSVQQMSQFDRMVLQGINPATFLPPIMTQPKETK